jgi:hypothetical protein
MNSIKIGIIAAGLTALSAVGVYSLYKYLSKRSLKGSKEETLIKLLDIKTFKKVLNEIMDDKIHNLIVGSRIIKQYEVETNPGTSYYKILCKYIKTY